MLETYEHLGKLLLLDDIDDLGKYSFEGHPSPIHHWQWGVLLIAVSEIGDALISAYRLLNEDDNNGTNKTPSNEKTDTR